MNRFSLPLGFASTAKSDVLFPAESEPL